MAGRLIVVFGAAVMADGRPSATLGRRIAYAAAAAALDRAAPVFCSGAVGRHPPSEAAVMAAALRRTIDPARLHLDEASTDTLTSVRAAVAFAAANGCDRCVVCTDRYHQPRVRMLFALFGMASEPVVFSRDVARTDRSYRWKMRAREAAAIPYDLVAGLAARLRR